MSFDGFVVNLPIGRHGLQGSKNLSIVDPDDLLVADNLTFQSGTIQKEGGVNEYNSTAITGTPNILGGWDWNHDGGTQRMIVVTDDGDILKDSGGGTFGTTLASGLTVVDGQGDPIVPIFVEGGKEAAANDRKLFIFTGVNPVQVLSADGATTSALSAPPADWSGANQPSFGLIHEGRLWAGGNSNDPHRLYYSDSSGTVDHEEFVTSDAGSFAIYPGEGERLVGAVSFRGGIVCFKHPRGIYFVDTTDPTLANWKVSRITNGVGAHWTGLIAHTYNDIAFVDETGEIRLISATDAFGDVSTDSISDIHYMSEFIRDNLNLSQAKQWRLQWYPTKRELHMACTRSGSTTNDARLVVDFNDRQLPRFRFSPINNPVSLWLREVNDVPELTAGGNDGKVYRLDQDGRSNNGVGYSGRFQTPHHDFGFLDPKLAYTRKQGHFLEIVVEPKGNWNLSVDVLWDNTTTETIQFNLGTTGAALGSFVLGTDALGTEQVLNKKRRMVGSGRRLSLLGYNSGDSQDFSLSNMMVHMTTMDERLDL